jgi:hypothetical protein
MPEAGTISGATLLPGRETDAKCADRAPLIRDLLDV